MAWAFDLGVTLLALALAAVVHRVLSSRASASALKQCPPKTGGQSPQSALSLAPVGAIEMAPNMTKSAAGVSAEPTGAIPATACAGHAARGRSRPSSEQLRAERSEFLRRVETSAPPPVLTKPQPRPQAPTATSQERGGGVASVSRTRFCERGTERGVWFSSAPCPDVLEWYRHPISARCAYPSCTVIGAGGRSAIASAPTHSRPRTSTAGR
jgi:hypothetical protein